jgi:hypothetical protein
MAKKNLDRLAAIREKLKKTDMATGGGGFWSPPVGKSIIRILPEVGDMEFFFQEVGKHNFPPDGKRSVYCPEFTSSGELECPVCDLVKDLRAATDTASKKLASELNRRRSYWMNVVVRGQEDRGPQIYTPGVQVFTSIAMIIEDPDYGMVTDVHEGFDITIIRTGTGLDTEYQVNPRRNPTPLSEDEDEIASWLDKARDLSYVEVSDDPEEDKDLIAGHAVYVLPYERIGREFNLDSLENEEDDEADYEEMPVAKPPKKKVAKRPIIEEDEDDYEEDEEVEEEEEEEEDNPPAKQEVSKRLARRSRR